MIDRERRKNGRVWHTEGATAQDIGDGRYRVDGIAGERIIKALSLSESYIIGNAPVAVEMVLTLQFFVPGNPPEQLLINRATVKWVTRAEIGADFDALRPRLAEQITRVISTLVKTQHGLSRIG